MSGRKICNGNFKRHWRALQHDNIHNETLLGETLPGGTLQRLMSPLETLVGRDVAGGDVDGRHCRGRKCAVQW